MRLRVTFLVAALHLLAGASSTSLTVTQPMAQARPAPRLGDEAAAWVASRGGLHESPDLVATQRIVDELALAAGLHPVALWVVNHDSPAACSAPPNDIFLNRGLVELLDENQLAAVIAHELAHLAQRHDGEVYHQLGEGHDSLDEEARADAVGLLILHRAGHDAGSMLAAMTTVRDHMGVKDPAWGVLNQRLNVLRRTIAALFPPDAPRG